MYSEEERAQIAKSSADAQRILNNPILDAYFRREIDDTFNAFCKLSPTAKLADYRAIHHKMINLHRFKMTLVGHITEARQMEENDRKVLAFEKGIGKPNI